MRVITLTMLILFLGCSGSKDAIVENSMMNSENPEINSDKVSPYTKTFLSKISEEMESDKSFVPSSDLIEEYELILIKDLYFIGVYLSVNPNLNEKEITDLNIKIGAKIDDIWTVKIPINKLRSLSSIAEVRYIQIDEPIKQKKIN